MVITFNGKNYQFDDVSYSWTITNGIREYVIEISFCGGVGEDGEEYLYNSCFADISVSEVNHRSFYDNGKYDDILKQVVDSIGKEYIEYTIDKDKSEYMSFRNESSYDDSMNDFNNVFGTLLNVLRERENPIVPCVE